MTSLENVEAVRILREILESAEAGGITSVAVAWFKEEEGVVPPAAAFEFHSNTAEGYKVIAEILQRVVVPYIAAKAAQNSTMTTEQ